MSEFTSVTAAGLVGDRDEWTDVEEQGSACEEWGDTAKPKVAQPNDKVLDQTISPGKGLTASAELGLEPAAEDYNEESRAASGGENWSWGAALSAFAAAVQQDVKEIAGSVKKSVSTLRDEFQTDEKAAQILNEGPAYEEKPLSEGSDKELEAGLGAIDQQVDQIASAAGKALGSLWTGIGGAITSTAQAASSVAGQLEQVALQATSTNGARPSPWSTRRYGGRSQGPWVLPRDGTQEDEWQVLDLLGSPATSVAASFDQLFKLYRGHRFSEELEALGNEAARSCNRVRTQLPEAQRAELDSIVAQTAACVDLLSMVSPSQDAHSAARALVHDIPSSSQHLETGKLPVAHRGGPREGLASMCAASVDRAAHMRDCLSTESPQKAWEGLCRVRAEGLKLLAEFTALSVQHMAFLAMCLEGGDAEAAGLEFLPDGSNKGSVVRGVLLQLLSDTDAIFEAFYTALEQATEDEEFAAMLLDQPADDGSDMAADELGIAQQQSSLSEISGGSARDAALQPNMALVVGELKGGLLVGVKAAVDRIMQGSRNLVYPICAPAAVRLDAETGLSPVAGIGHQPYEHIDQEPLASADGSDPLGRKRTTSLSNPLFETVGAIPSHMTSHDSMSVTMENSIAEGTGPRQHTESAAEEAADVSLEATSPLTGAVTSSANMTATPPAVEEEQSMTQVEPPCLGHSPPATVSHEQIPVQDLQPNNSEHSVAVGKLDVAADVEDVATEATSGGEQAIVTSAGSGDLERVAGLGMDGSASAELEKKPAEDADEELAPPENEEAAAADEVT